MNLEDKFTGTLVGVAVGDALGGPLEEIPKHPIETKYVTEMIGGGWLKLKSGQITDDTEMTLCIARSIAEKKFFDPEDIASKFVEWLSDSPIGAGGTTKTAIERLKQGLQWYESGYSDTGLTGRGNGAVMRCSPIALLNYKNPDELALHSYQQSIITHSHPHCTNSAIFYNTIIAGLLNGKSKQEAYENALNTIKHETALLKRYEKIPEATPNRPSGEVKNTTEASIHCLLTTQSFEEAIIKAVNLGGDADTTGAITGALAGALYGEQQIPQRWKNALIDRHEKKILDELICLGRIIYSLTE